MDLQPDVGHQPIVGPALRVSGHLLTWKGPPPSSSAALQPSSKLALQGRGTQSESALNLTSKAQLTSAASLMDLPSPVASQLQLEFQKKYVYQQPIELRVNFDGKPNEMTSSFLEMENCGTAAVYYSWQVSTHNNIHVFVIFMYLCDVHVDDVLCPFHSSCCQNLILLKPSRLELRRGFILTQGEVS